MTEFFDDIVDGIDDNKLFYEAAVRSGINFRVIEPSKTRPAYSQYNLSVRCGGANFTEERNLAHRRTRDEYAQVLKNVFEIVQWALTSHERPVVLKLKGPALTYDVVDFVQRHLFLSNFPQAVEVIKKLSDANRYDEYIELFREACVEMGLFSDPLVANVTFWEGTDQFFDDEFSCRYQIFNDFIDRLREIEKRRGARQRRHERLRDAKERLADQEKYFDGLIEKYRRLVVVRVDFGYLKEFNSFSMIDIKRDFDDFLKKRRSRPEVFAGLVGYVAKFEYGVDKGAHIHLIFFFDGDKRQDSAFIFAKKIGEFWCDTTKFNGDYFNCHSRDRLHESHGRLGVGLIRVDDLHKRSLFKKYVLSYLCKAGSYAYPKELQGFRSIRRGVLPRIKAVRTKGRCKRDIANKSIS